MARDAIEAGCAVFCEKTMCHSIDQARELAAIVDRRKAVFQVGLQRRANAIYRQAEAMVESGMLGEVSAIKCQWHRNNNWRRPVPVPRADPRWEALERRLNWRLYRDHSQGLMSELAAHQLDVANRLLGGPPRRVIGSGGIDHWRDGREVFDNVFCIYEYEVGEGPARRTVRVTYSSIQDNAFEGASELVMGTKGTLLLTQSKGLFYREAVADDPGLGGPRGAGRPRRLDHHLGQDPQALQRPLGPSRQAVRDRVRRATTPAPSWSPSSTTSDAATRPRSATPATAWSTPRPS